MMRTVLDSAEHVRGSRPLHETLGERGHPVPPRTAPAMFILAPDGGHFVARPQWSYSWGG